MIWQYSNRFELRSRLIADRHYNRQKPGTPQFVPPGRCAVFYASSPTGQALWVTSWPFAEYVRHAWPGAWVCSAFRNEGCGSGLGTHSRRSQGHQSGLGTASAGKITFINRAHVRPTMVRGGPVYRWTYLKAGFRVAGETKGGLLALHLPRELIPAPQRALTELEAAAVYRARLIDLAHLARQIHVTR